jgi:hypothetical protein
MLKVMTPKYRSIGNTGVRAGLRGARLIAVGAVAAQAVDYVVEFGYLMSGGMQSSYIAPATIGTSIVFATALVVTALSYWKSRHEAREARRTLSEVSVLVTHGADQAVKIAAIGQTLRRSTDLSSISGR